MSEIKAGDIVAIKTTGEAVYVIELRPDDAQVKVRRPCASREGIKHLLEIFLVDELETIDEHVTRELDEVEARHKLINERKAAVVAAGNPVTDVVQ